MHVKFFEWQSRRHDITGSNCLKGVSGKEIVDEKWIKDARKEYMEKLMNEETNGIIGYQLELKQIVSRLLK